MDALKTCSLFDLRYTLAEPLLSRCSYPWEALPALDDFLLSLGRSGGFCEIERGVFVHGSAKIAPSVCLCAPCVICAGAQVRHGAFLRGGVLVGKDCVVGNSELKHCILFDGVQVPHFNYVGDSVLGYRAHLGAGVILSNLRGDRRPVRIRCRGEWETGLIKCGSFVGDGGEVGCNAVLNPGTVLGKGVRIYPLVSAVGYYPPGCVVKE